MLAGVCVLLWDSLMFLGRWEGWAEGRDVRSGLGREPVVAWRMQGDSGAEAKPESIVPRGSHLNPLHKMPEDIAPETLSPAHAGVFTASVARGGSIGWRSVVDASDLAYRSRLHAWHGATRGHKHQSIAIVYCKSSMLRAAVSLDRRLERQSRLNGNET